jgi:hypothetical protein
MGELGPLHVLVFVVFAMLVWAVVMCLKSVVKGLRGRR